MRAKRALSRRQFLQGLGVAATAPIMVPRSVLGGTGHVGPGDRITVGVIGCGKIAFDYHLPELLGARDVQVLAVCDVDTNRRNRAKQIVEQAYASTDRATKHCDAYNDFRELLARRDIDAVLIATPDHWHALPLIEACKAGKDVYCEKPLTLTLAEGKRCIEAARKYRRVVQTGSQQRSNVFGNFREACEWIRSGRIGKVQRVTVGVGGPPRPCDLPGEPVEPGLDWNLWLGPAPMRPYHSELSPRGIHNHFPAWRNYQEYAGGAHADMGAHHYDIAQWALDMDTSGPTEILPPDDPGAESGVRFRYANGVEMVHGGPGGCVFYGTRGKLHIDRGVLETDPPELLKEPPGPNDVQLFRSPGHHRNWLDCIRTRERPICDVEIGARAAAITQLGNLAYRYRRRMQWDPKRWQFVNDREANSWMDYPRRDPWQLPRV
ncbi:MAG: Gfo/Idh/MocA family oxidoreductase [Chloroherpetonaceae bacterium]|nr:Gfo/Idh/MocA family oxidoreductase [Chthonomonadaceae bacterium]MDW8206230.1 Gfo/Idh/MocA family oxidoreductase [Chloroherpetonaceae bacterium]